MEAVNLSMIDIFGFGVNHFANYFAVKSSLPGPRSSKSHAAIPAAKRRSGF
jgi:hypothetical protein